MRLIDADALYIEIMDRGIDGLQLDDLSEIQQVIADAPTVDAVPVRLGEWVEIGHETECPFCGEPTGLMTPYCPQCGAKLDRPKR